MNRVNVKFKSLAIKVEPWGQDYERNVIDAQYVATHSNGTSTLEQKLTLRYDYDHNDKKMGWRAEISLDDFPVQDSPQEAARKLADWLLRLSKAVRSGKYDSLSLKKLQAENNFNIMTK